MQNLNLFVFNHLQEPNHCETVARLTQKKGKCKKKSTGFLKKEFWRKKPFFIRDLADLSYVLDLFRWQFIAKNYAEKKEINRIFACRPIS
jgi:hypothetical protein